MTIAAVLLAGGQSRRMGRDKALLEQDGRPLWERQLSLLRRLSPDALFVSARKAPPWLPEDTLFIPDPTPDRGPLGAIAATLSATSATHLVALAIDMPAMTAAHLRKLRAAATHRCGVLPWLNGRPEPFPAVYPTAALSIAIGILAGEDVSVTAFALTLLEAGLVKRQTITSRDAKLYVNCNTPADWRRHASHD